MNSLRPAAKFGFVSLGFAAAIAAACLAVTIREYYTDGPEAQASSGMYAAGDAMLGVAVFGILAIAPTALALYWLRPVPAFWTVLTWSAVLYALTGIGALGLRFASTSGSLGGWMALLSILRIAIMPVGALTLLTCAVFAPKPRHRWTLTATFLIEAGIFAGIVLMKFILPSLHS